VKNGIFVFDYGLAQDACDRLSEEVIDELKNFAVIDKQFDSLPDLYKLISTNPWLNKNELRPMFKRDLEKIQG
jgi:hypothetical protein